LHLCASRFGSDTKDYREAGYDVRLITEEVDVRTYEPPENVYGVFANPPCQKFSMANPTPRADRDFKEGIELVEACLKIIWKLQATGAPLAFWVLENPRGYLERFLGKPAFEFQNWEFGDTGPLATKRTRLWGFFNEPQRMVAHRVVPYIHDGSRRPKRNEIFKTLFPVDLPKARNKKFLKMSSDERSIASPHFTRAFFEANQ
jgi:hypothetical protein